MKQVALSEIKDDLSKYLRLAETEEIVITRHGKPAGILRGFASEDDWFEYRLEHDPRFLRRIGQARQSLEAGKGVKLEELQLAPRRSAAEPNVAPDRGRRTASRASKSRQRPRQVN
jgi:prevent-host-death family protein